MARKIKKPKPDQAYIATTQSLATIQRATEEIYSAAANIIELVRAHELSVDKRIAENQLAVNEYITNPDNRPVLVVRKFKAETIVALNDQVYSYGPRKDINSLDDDEPAFFWRYGSDTEQFPARTYSDALLAILQHYCRKEEPDDADTDATATGATADPDPLAGSDP